MNRPKRLPAVAYVAVMGLLITATISVSIYSCMVEPFRNAIRASNILIDGLTANDMDLVRTATDCEECASRLREQWAKATGQWGALRSRRFQRVVLATELGAKQTTSASAMWYEVEYEMDFDKQSKVLVVVIVERSSGAASRAVDIHWQQVIRTPL